MSRIAIIIPTFNELNNIEKLIRGIKKFLPKAIIFIVDDSKNKKIKTLLELKKLKVNYFHRKNSFGRGSAVLYGLKRAIKKKFDIYIEMDADYSHNPNELNRNIKFFKSKKLDLLIGSRYLSQSKIINWDLSRKLLSFLANFLVKKLLDIKINDFTNGFRFYSERSIKKIIEKCGNIGGGFIILSEIIVVLNNNNYKIDEVPTIFLNRKRGKSAVTLKLIIESLFGLFKLSIIKKKLY